MKSQGDITGRTGDWEDLQPRGEGGANWQVSEARTAGLEDVPPPAPPGPYCEISHRNMTQTGAIMGSCPRPTLQSSTART